VQAVPRSLCLVLDLRFAQPQHAAQLLGRHLVIQELAYLPECEAEPGSENQRRGSSRIAEIPTASDTTAAASPIKAP
jgi:hypothetical protein